MKLKDLLEALGIDYNIRWATKLDLNADVAIEYTNDASVHPDDVETKILEIAKIERNSSTAHPIHIIVQDE